MKLEDIEIFFDPSPCFSNAKQGFSWIQEGDLIICGIPVDLTQTYLSGSRFAPDQIRLASVNLEPGSIRLKRTIEGASFSDIGNLSINSINIDEILDNVGKISSVIYGSNHFPVFLGGEHSITPFLLPKIEDGLGVIIFDAHLDLREEYQGSIHSHACTSRRVVSRVGEENLLLIGPRALCKEEFTFMESHPVKCVTSPEISRMTRKELMDEINEFSREHESIYVSIDMDVFDPAFAPGVGNPEPDGISPSTVLDLISGLDKDKLIGCDVVEVSGFQDDKITSILAARVVFEFLNLKIGN
ncbi:MAG: agmatinase [Promethearchaeota archaeon]